MRKKLKIKISECARTRAREDIFFARRTATPSLRSEERTYERWKINPNQTIL